MREKELLYHAFLLAKKANPKEIRPNPFVGAIVVCENGKIIGEGYHQKVGEAHAEVNAINNALQNGADLKKSTLYVTLEPCSHHGKTPPCTSLILEHKIPHVIIGSLDPNPLVSGIEILEKSGVKVTKLILPEIQEMNTVFNINQQLKRPKYIIKTASTLNGKIADRDGKSQWISSETSRAFVHKELRANVDGILSTAKTVIQDKARLNIRLTDGTVSEVNTIIIDKQLSLFNEEYQNLPIFQKRNSTKLYIVTEKQDLPIVPEYIEFIKINFEHNCIDFNALHESLLSKNICFVLVEAGSKLNTSMLLNHSIDEIYAFVCPSIITDALAKNIFETDRIQLMDEKIKLQLMEFKQLENDMLLRYKVLS